MASDLNAELSKKTAILGLKVWEVIGICVALKLRKFGWNKYRQMSLYLVMGFCLTIHDKSSDKESDRSGSSGYGESEEWRQYESVRFFSSFRERLWITISGLPEFSHLGWGHWFTLRDLELATNRFSKENVLEAKRKRSLGVEVDAIGHVRHKNLVRLLGYCIEGTHRILVYEYVNNGNLEQWLHGAMRQHGYLTWEAALKVLLGTAKGVLPICTRPLKPNKKQSLVRDPLDYGRPTHEFKDERTTSFLASDSKMNSFLSP
ncbi:hypothetical protein NC653_012579 [Populus alba x Populus x berolinensis]|uniref:non-specific serine/threonine protein kinase n=1 Tax=Populus alba x Populus x berolinensis TaxID=444605 RepID=A0AAD6QSB7_9ROSI|nr:hypothetical protein NC653_012579 [Populus alba x Populus x berolinensis]